jgi:hypothetical protein
MAAKDEDHGDQHVAHVAFKIPDFWPHDPNTWFPKIVSKFRICNIRQSPTKYDHLLSALPTDICSSINDSLAEIDENADDGYEQLKELLMTRYTMDRWARAFELHKFPEIGDMKPSEMMQQMKALLPQSNGLVERFHRRLKDALRSWAAAADWHDHLPWVMLGIRASFREDSEFSPAEAVFGSQLILPGQFINTSRRRRPSSVTCKPP